ncbi:MAG: phytanoyl-CoA dioxygenase family protein [Acidimicrobiales bacterium]
MQIPPPADLRLDQVRSAGFQVVPGAFDATTVDDARRLVQAHVGLMKRTRPTPSSRHLAGFHRFPALEPLHLALTANPTVLRCMSELLGGELRTIGLSDITIDRSQQWHKDLLRGPYRGFLASDGVCAANHGKAFKVIMYLQDSDSLQVIPGSHRRDIDLSDDEHAIPGPADHVVSVPVRRGDAVILDLCTTHRGTDEDAYATSPPGTPARILVSTVFTRARCEFADQLEAGNAARLADWSRRPMEPASSSVA